MAALCSAHPVETTTYLCVKPNPQPSTWALYPARSAHTMPIGNLSSNPREPVSKRTNMHKQQKTELGVSTYSSAWKPCFLCHCTTKGCSFDLRGNLMRLCRTSQARAVKGNAVKDTQWVSVIDGHKDKCKEGFTVLSAELLLQPPRSLRIAQLCAPIEEKSNQIQLLWKQNMWATKWRLNHIKWGIHCNWDDCKSLLVSVLWSNQEKKHPRLQTGKVWKDYVTK